DRDSREDRGNTARTHRQTGIMRFWIAALALATLATPSISDARGRPRYSHSYSHGHADGSGYYLARSRHHVRRPVRAFQAPAGASAQCRDGSWSFSESRRGTCSWHGGVSRWL